MPQTSASGVDRRTLRGIRPREFLRVLVKVLDAPSSFGAPRRTPIFRATYRQETMDPPTQSNPVVSASSFPSRLSAHRKRFGRWSGAGALVLVGLCVCCVLPSCQHRALLSAAERLGHLRGITRGAEHWGPHSWRGAKVRPNTGPQAHPRCEEWCGRFLILLEPSLLAQKCFGQFCWPPHRNLAGAYGIHATRAFYLFDSGT